MDKEEFERNQIPLFPEETEMAVHAEVVPPGTSVNAEKTIPELTPDQRRYRLEKAEEDIAAAIQEQKHAWVMMYHIIDRVKVDELWRARKKYHSFTAWLGDLAGKFGLKVRQLSDAYQAGAFYERIRLDAEKQGVQLPSLDKTPAAISPVTLRDAEKWSRSKTQGETAAIVSKIADGSIRRSEMSKLWKDEKKRGTAVTYKSRHEKAAATNPPVSKSVDTEKSTLTAAIIKQILRTDPSWLPRPTVPTGYELLRYADKKCYAALDEFRVRVVNQKSPDRVDSMAFQVLETIEESTQHDQYSILIHGIEIKVSPYDLTNDKKVIDYAPYCDYLWFCIPDTEEMKAAASAKLEELPQGIGVLLVNPSTYTISRWIDAAELTGQGSRREMALTVAVLKLVEQKRVITPRILPPTTETENGE